MRAIEIMLLIMCINIGIGVIGLTGLFSPKHYEKSLTQIGEWGNPSAVFEEEKTKVSYNIIEDVFRILTWDWIKDYFQPLYSMDENVKRVVDGFTIFMGGINMVLIGAATLQLLNRLLGRVL